MMKKSYVWLAVFVLIGITIGYAVLNTTLNINGKSTISKNTWDVHFDNINVTDESVEAVKLPTIEDDTTVDFEIALNMPGDFYEFTVDVVNNGTIDAMIDSINKTPDLTVAQAKYLNYIIEYQNGEQITTKQLVKKDESVRLKVRVELRKDIDPSDLPEVGDVLYLSFTTNYVQADNTGISVKDNGLETKIVSANGSLDDIGTIVTIGTEQFYIIGTEGNNVKLLSLMNIALTNYPTQNSGAGRTKFSNSGTSYSGSIVEDYVNKYKTVLETNFGVDIIEARVITYDELVSDTIGCSTSNYSCKNAPKWISYYNYWTSTAKDDTYIYCILTMGSISSVDFTNSNAAGVRPVIVISKDNF